MSVRLGEIDVTEHPLPDLHALQHEMRRQGRISYVKIRGVPAPILTHYEDVMEAYRDEESFPAPAAYSVIAGPVMGKTIQCMTGEEHRLHRELVRSAFKPSIAKDYVPTIFSSIAHEIVDRFVGRGRNPAGMRHPCAVPSPSRDRVTVCGWVPYGRSSGCCAGWVPGPIRRRRQRARGSVRSRSSPRHPETDRSHFGSTPLSVPLPSGAT
jgi:hypothetical protein